MLDYQDILGSKGFQEKEDPLDSEVSGLTGWGGCHTAASQGECNALLSGFGQKPTVCM